MHANSEFVVNRVAIEGRRIKQFIITFLIKSLKKSYLLFIYSFIYLTSFTMMTMLRKTREKKHLKNI